MYRLDPLRLYTSQTRCAHALRLLRPLLPHRKCPILCSAAPRFAHFRAAYYVDPLKIHLHQRFVEWHANCLENTNGSRDI